MFSLIVMPHAISAESDSAQPITGKYRILFEDTYTRIAQNLLFSLGYIGFLAVCEYNAKDALIADKRLVKNNYPHAQAWYNALAKKYPQAGLETKVFLQSHTIGSFDNYIYMPQSVLAFIESCYQNKIKKVRLDAQQEAFLVEQEFYILREAGCLERNDVQQKYAALTCLAIASEGLAYGLSELIQNRTTTYDNRADFDKAFAAYNFNGRCIWLATTITAVGVYFYLRDQQAKNTNAYVSNMIALQTCDTQSKKN
jgi:hypothetical protein